MALTIRLQKTLIKSNINLREQIWIYQKGIGIVTLAGSGAHDFT